LCATAFVVINVTASGVNVNLPPVATPDVTTTNVNVPVVINVKANDYDPNVGQVLGLPTITSQSTRGVATVNPDGTVTFTPATGFVGVTSFVYQVCDNGSPSACSTALVTVNVVAAPPIGTTNQPPVAIDDASTTTVNNAIVASSAGNDYDPNSGQTLSFVSTSIPAHGSVVMLPNGSYTYTPATGYVGPDQFKYKVCDNGVPSLCDSATVFITILDNPCITLTFKAMLEGPFNTTTGRMNTILNQRGLLPGQTPVGQFAVTTPVGQPYNVAPWNYAGIPSDTIRTYAADIVDWVLVSLRSDSTTATSTVWKAAGLLHSDGTITFTQPCFRFPLGSYFALVEHRNHLGVMSPVKLPVVNGILTFDFSTADSYIRTNPPSFGEKLKGGKYLMYAGDGKKTTATTNFDINFSDSQQWKTESGVFDQYRYSDFNLDADVNFADQVLWKANNGKYSGVPH
jgi:Bacterial Ig domain